MKTYSAMRTEPLVEVEVAPRSPRIKAIMAEKGNPMFLYRRKVPASIAVKIQLGTKEQQAEGHADARRWLRDNLGTFDQMDQAYLL